jgi:hypothetical protein
MRINTVSILLQYGKNNGRERKRGFMKPNDTWRIVFPFLIALPAVTGCRLLPVTDMSPPLTQMAITREDISSWVPQADMEIYIGTQLFDLNDGGAPQYLEKGLIKTGYQVLNGQNGTVVTSMIMDFGKDSNAVSIFLEMQTKNAGQTVGDPIYPDSVAFMTLVVGGVTGYCHYKNYYFEIAATGFSDIALAIQTFDLFFNLYRKKVDSR